MYVYIYMYYTGIFILIAIFIVFQFQVKTPYFFVACLATGWFKDLHLLSPHGHRMLRADVEDVFRQAWCLEILDRTVPDLKWLVEVIDDEDCGSCFIGLLLPSGRIVGESYWRRSTIFNDDDPLFQWPCLISYVKLPEGKPKTHLMR